MGTKTPPALCIAMPARTHSFIFGAQIATRSPGKIPKLIMLDAMLVDILSKSKKDNVSTSEINAGLEE